MNIYKFLLGISGISAIGAVVMLFAGSMATFGMFLTITFASLALGVKAVNALKGYSLTIWILTGVSSAMFYPQYFTEMGGFKFSKLIIPLMQIIMFGMGTTMSIKDFIGVAKMPKAIIVGLIILYGLIPLYAFSLTIVFPFFEPEVAAGIILMGAVPCGLASNVMNYIAGSNLALSITLTAFATVLAPFLTPPVMSLLASQLAEPVTIDVLKMMKEIFFIVIIPIAGGLIFNHFLHGKIKWLDRLMPILSMVGIVYIITIITAAGRDKLLVMGPMLIIVCVILNFTGYVFGYWISKLFRLDERSCRTLAIECGLKNGGLASGISLGMGKLATMGLASVVYGPLMNVSGSILANWWRNHPVKDGKSTPQAETH
jgi:bile acid:Na+ symporter, BASS family